MTKRFGRNQKRAMRAQIATADALAAQRLQMAEYSRREAKYVRDELDEAKDIAAALGVNYLTAMDRLKSGLSTEQALGLAP